MTVDLNNKDIDILAVGKQALKDGKLLTELLGNLCSKNETIRYNSHKVLFFLTENHPHKPYPKWDYFLTFLDSDNTYHKLSAVLFLGNLTQVDKNNKFEKIFEKYYGLLNDKSFIIAAYVCGASGKIAKAKPKLQTKITNLLLDIDKTNHQQERIDMVKASIIDAFGQYYQQTSNKKRILEFVERQLNCQSPKTRKKAKEFLKRFNKTG
ncbi:hypothetical protein ACFLZ8_01030 [Planctomycetota bacterium]